MTTKNFTSIILEEDNIERGITTSPKSLLLSNNNFNKLL